MPQRNIIIKHSLMILFLMPSSVFASEIVLKSGQKIEGKIIEQTDKYVKIDPGVGVDVTYYKDEIATISQEGPDKNPVAVDAAPVLPKETSASSNDKGSADENTGQNTPSENEISGIFKSYWEKKNACTNFDEFKELTKEYGTKDMLSKLSSPETANLNPVLKDQMFTFMKSTFFDLSEVENMKIKTGADTAVIEYDRKGHPEFKGTFTLVKEDGAWKLKEDGQKVRMDASNK